MSHTASTGPSIQTGGVEIPGQGALRTQVESPLLRPSTGEDPKQSSDQRHPVCSVGDDASFQCRCGFCVAGRAGQQDEVRQVPCVVSQALRVSARCPTHLFIDELHFLHTNGTRRAGVIFFRHSCGWWLDREGDGRYSGTSSATPQNAFKGFWHRSYFCLGRQGSHHPDRQSYEGARCSNERSVGPCCSLVPEDLGPQEASEGQRLNEQGTDYSDWAACRNQGLPPEPSHTSARRVAVPEPQFQRSRGSTMPGHGTR